MDLRKQAADVPAGVRLCGAAPYEGDRVRPLPKRKDLCPQVAPIFGTPMLFIADELGKRKYELTVHDLMDQGMAAGGGLDA